MTDSELGKVLLRKSEVRGLVLPYFITYSKAVLTHSFKKYLLNTYYFLGSLT